jgi:hypothetical protein
LFTKVSEPGSYIDEGRGVILNFSIIIDVPVAVDAI